MSELPLSPTQKRLRRFKEKYQEVEARLKSFNALKHDILNFDADAMSSVTSPYSKRINQNDTEEKIPTETIKSLLMVSPMVENKAMHQETHNVETSQLSSDSRCKQLEEKVKRLENAFAKLEKKHTTLLKRLDIVENSLIDNSKCLAYNISGFQGKEERFV